MSPRTFRNHASGFLCRIATLGGVRGSANFAAWTVAGGAAYYLWIRPEHQAREEREVLYNLSEFFSWGREKSIKQMI